MLTKYSFPLFLLAFLLFAGGIARAEITIKPGGAVEIPKMETDPDGEYFDIYDRQLSYADSNKPFVDSMKKRQQAFAKPSNTAARNYRKNLKTRYGFDEKKSEEESTGQPDEDLYGPPEPANP